MAGVDRPSDVVMVEKWVKKEFPLVECNVSLLTLRNWLCPLNRLLQVYNDAVSALASGTGGRLWGIGTVK